VKGTLVIIPTFNEKENISAIIHEIFFVSSQVSILVVDDGSPDGTGAIVKDIQLEEFPYRLHLLERKGKLGLGTAYIAGFKYALEKGFDYIIEMDADFSHNPLDLPKLYKACTDGGADAALGSRYKNGVNVVNWPMKRVLLSFFASKYVRFITGLPLNDTTAGFICYKREVLESLNLEKIKFIGYAFQIEMKFKTWKKGFEIVEVPIIFTDRTQGESKMSGSIFKEAIFGVMDLRLQSIFKNPSKF
jgi:dolichol-phosphate mannosyltransferase